MKKMMSLLTLIGLILGISSCGKNGNFTPYDYLVPAVITETNHQVMPLNTRVFIRMFEDSEAIRNEIYTTFADSIAKSHRLFDRYNFYQDNGTRIQNLRVINESYGTGTSVVVDPDLYRLLELSIEITEVTQGYFNPTMGELLDVWQYDEYGDERYTAFGGARFDPLPSDVEAARACIVPHDQIRNIIALNPAESSVTFHAYQACSRITISLGAIAKGFALDLAKTKLTQSFPNTPIIMDAGSSSIITIGINPTPTSQNRPKKYQGKWLVGMISANVPYLAIDRSQYVVATLAFSGNRTFSTSGDFERYYYSLDSDPIGLKRNHIINPHTGYSETYWRLLSVFGEGKSAILDGLSTALINLESLEDIMTMLTAANNYFNITTGVFIEEDGADNKLTIHASSYFYNHLDTTTIKASLVTSTEINIID